MKYCQNIILNKRGFIIAMGFKPIAIIQTSFYVFFNLLKPAEFRRRIAKTKRGSFL